MSWIETVPHENATGRLRQLYDRLQGPGARVDNIMRLHSLRPHTMVGHMALYKHVLHHGANRVPKRFLETIGVWVSLLNDCLYCVEHHFAGLTRLIGDEAEARAIRRALESGEIEAGPFEGREQRALRYAEGLTRNPARVGEPEILGMREAGYDDGEILEINQVTAYFAYANRTVLGLGCTLDEDVLGLSPGNPDDPDDWSHG